MVHRARTRSSRLPISTHRYGLSIVLAVAVLDVVFVVVTVNANALPVLPANADALLTPNLTAG